MIIFYIKTTGEIVGVINGRIHDQHTLDNALIRPSDVPESKIGKIILKHDDKKFKKLVLSFESGKLSPYQYIVEKDSLKKAK